MLSNSVRRSGPGSDVTALRELFTELLRDKDTVQRLAALTAGSDIRYDLGGADSHPLIGRFAPDMELDTPDGTVRLAELTRNARPLLLDLTGDKGLAESLPEWHDQLDIVTARPQPGLPAVLLLRPDCYVAWATASPHLDTADRQALRTALQRCLLPVGRTSRPSAAGIH